MLRLIQMALVTLALTGIPHLGQADITALPGPTGKFVVQDGTQTDQLIVDTNGVAIPGLTGSTGSALCAGSAGGLLGKCEGNPLGLEVIISDLLIPDGSVAPGAGFSADSSECPEGKSVISGGFVAVSPLKMDLESSFGRASDNYKSWRFSLVNNTPDPQPENPVGENTPLIMQTFCINGTIKETLIPANPP